MPRRKTVKLTAAELKKLDREAKKFAADLVKRLGAPGVMPKKITVTGGGKKIVVIPKRKAAPRRHPKKRRPEQNHRPNTVISGSPVYAESIDHAMHSARTSKWQVGKGAETYTEANPEFAEQPVDEESVSQEEQSANEESVSQEEQSADEIVIPPDPTIVSAVTAEQMETPVPRALKDIKRTPEEQATHEALMMAKAAAREERMAKQEAAMQRATLPKYTAPRKRSEYNGAIAARLEGHSWPQALAFAKERPANKKNPRYYDITPDNHIAGGSIDSDTFDTNGAIKILDKDKYVVLDIERPKLITRKLLLGVPLDYVDELLPATRKYGDQLINIVAAVEFLRIAAGEAATRRTIEYNNIYEEFPEAVTKRVRAIANSKYPGGKYPSAIKDKIELMEHQASTKQANINAFNTKKAAEKKS